MKTMNENLFPMPTTKNFPLLFLKRNPKLHTLTKLLGTSLVPHTRCLRLKTTAKSTACSVILFSSFLFPTQNLFFHCYICCQTCSQFRICLAFAAARDFSSSSLFTLHYVIPFSILISYSLNWNTKTMT